MTNREMMEIAMRQSAEDMGCRVEDFKADKNVVVPINLGKKARKYLKEPITCNLAFLIEMEIQEERGKRLKKDEA